MNQGANSQEFVKKFKTLLGIKNLLRICQANSKSFMLIILLNPHNILLNYIQLHTLSLCFEMKKMSFSVVNLLSKSTHYAGHYQNLNSKSV